MSTLRAVPLLRTLALFIAPLCMAHASLLNTPDGTITVTDVVTPIGSLFQYDYSVSDGTGLLAVLDIAVTPGIDISDLTAPGGPEAFETAYDSELGLISFLENESTFSAAPESGFIFDSSVAPGPGSFGVTLFDGTTGTGSVSGPVAPEPSSMALLALGWAALVVLRKMSLSSGFTQQSDKEFR